MITKLVDVEYLPDAVSPKFHEFLVMATGNDVELQRYLQLAVGYSFTGLTDEQCLFFLYGILMYF